MNKILDVISPEMMEVYTNDPIAFVEDIIFRGNITSNGGEFFITDDQKKVLKALGEKKKKISIRSGRSCGKSVLDVWIAIWFLSTRPLSKVIITAPTFKQVNGVLWANMARWIRESYLAKCFVITKTRIYANDNPKEWYADAITAKKEEEFQGYHDPHLLLICDEASGITDPIYNTVQGSMSEEDNITILSGNPTQTSGFFFDSHNKNRERWACFHFSSLDSPFATKDFLEDYRQRYGEVHQLYKVHILGEFPSGSPESYISLERVLGATLRQASASGDVQIGVDVAHYGDDLTAIAWRFGNKVFPIETKSQTSIPDTTGLVLNKIKEIREIYGYTGTIRVCVDAGGVGAGVADELAMDRKNNIEVVPVNFGSSGDELHEYYCTVLWSNVKNLIDVIELPDDPDLINELSTRRYKITPSGKERIEPKSEFKKEFGKSPDKADSVILAFANTVNTAKVVKEFDYLDKSMVYDIYQKGYIVGSGDKYCTIYQSKDRMFHILYCIWNMGKLYIYDELETNENVLSVARNIQSKGQFAKISGNDRMFGEFKEDVSSQFRKYNVSLYENYRYDEAGAIECLNLLVKNKTIIIHNACRIIISQLRRWSFDKNKTNLEIDYGMCYSLLNIISELKDKIMPQKIIPRFQEYSKERELAVKSIRLSKFGKNKNKWQSW